MRFYLGTHEAHWVWRTNVPLFISARRLRRIKKLRPATCEWALDSGGFSELTLYDGWVTEPEQYVDEVRHWSASLGSMQWAAIQDWMCEPHMIEKTGKSVREHQELTVDNYLKLKLLAPEIPWRPVLQGWELGDYWECLELYRSAGCQDIHFGIGSVCRRQQTNGVGELIKELHAEGLKLHAFGFKKRGLPSTQYFLDSSDSMAWSTRARHCEPLPGCTHKSCANCMKFALKWRAELEELLAAHRRRQ